METFTETKIYEDMERNNKIKNIDIKPTTAKAYVRNVIKLLKLINANSYSALITEFHKLTEFFKKEENGKRLYSDNTIKNYINCILMVGSWDLCKDINPDKIEPIIDYYSQTKEKINNKQMDNTKPNDAEWITTKDFDNILKKMRKQVDNNGTTEQLQDFIIMLLYSGKWIRPLRNDYAGMYFSKIHHEVKDHNYIWVQENKDTSDNVLDRRFTIVLNDDKVSKHYGAKEYKIAKLTILSNYLDLLYERRGDMVDGFTPTAATIIKRDFLVNPQDNKPMSKNNLTKNLQRITQTWLNKKVSTSALRHMYISNLDHNKTTNKKLAQIAKDMRHSIKTQQQNYKLVDAN